MNPTQNEKVPRRSALKLIGTSGLALTLSGVLGYLYGFQIEPYWLSVEHVRIPIKDLPDELEGFTLVCLSDFHHEPSDNLRHVRRVVETVNELHPDVICLLGDYVFSDAKAIYALVEPLSDLQATEGVYAVLGNHDYWTDVHTVIEGLQQAGSVVLINQVVRLERGGQSLFLIGLDDGWSGTPDPMGPLRSTPADVPAIMLMHEPDFADGIAALGQVDLQLSGHSHGGQVKPFFLKAPFRPQYAQKYVAGLYQVDQLQLYVTRGVGTIPPRARFNCRPEITEIVLIPAGS
ncbi:MAG: metallophosphoesterase [Anaerolineales bacterium]|jgi:hypothetical protein